MNRKLLLGLVCLLLAGLWVTAAFAGPQANLHLEWEESASGLTPWTFSAYGQAVVDGRVCAAGTVETLSTEQFGPSNASYIKYRVEKRLTCSDGSGYFDLKVTEKVDRVTFHTTGTWMVTGGTGNYSSLGGHGDLEGVPVSIGLVVQNYYDGNAR